MQSKLKVLKPLIIPHGDVAAQARYELLNERWDRARASCSSLLIPIFEAVYYAVLAHYVETAKAMPLQQMARLYNRRIANVMQRAGLEPMPMRDLLECVSMSQSAPIRSNTTERAGIMLLPDIAIQTYNSRALQGEPVPDFTRFIRGHVEGPRLSERGMQLGYAPFPDETDELAQFDQKFDTSANAADALAYAVAVSPSNAEATESSTLSPETE